MRNSLTGTARLALGNPEATARSGVLEITRKFRRNREQPRSLPARLPVTNRPNFFKAPFPANLPIADDLSSGSVRFRDGSSRNRTIWRSMKR